MSRLTRYTQQIFGVNSGYQQMGQFGSVTSPNYTTNIATIQALSAWTTGWYAAATGQNAPAIQDMNAVHYVLAYQMAYLMQVGIAEWDSGTTYYIGDVVNDGAGNVYYSIANTNLDNAVTSTTYWQPLLPLPTSGMPYQNLQSNATSNGTQWSYAHYNPTTATGSKTGPSGYNETLGNLTIGSGNTWTYPSGSSLSAIGPLIASGTGVIQATGTGKIRVV